MHKQKDHPILDGGGLPKRVVKEKNLSQPHFQPQEEAPQALPYPYEQKWGQARPYESIAHLQKRQYLFSKNDVEEKYTVILLLSTCISYLKTQGTNC